MSKVNILNGDCLEIMRVLEDNSIDLIVTDPPYGVNFKQSFYDDSEDYVLTNLNNWYKEWFRLLKEDSYLFVFVGVKQIHNFIQAGIEVGFTYKNIIASRSYNNGVKKAPNNFGFQFQPILVFSKGKGRALNNVDFIPTSEAWYKDKRNKNPKPYTYEYPNWLQTDWVFATAKRASKNIHPNEKNVDLLEFLIQTSSVEGQTVLDCFLGSGSTGIAAVNTYRDFIGVEKDEGYFKTAKERIEKALESRKEKAS